MVLSQAYPQAVAGVPITFSYSPLSDVFNLTYVRNHRIHAPTVVFVPTELHYPDGYCARVSGARVTSRSGSDQLRITNARSGDSVTVSVTPGRCVPASQRAR
jgi:endoglycosylceramidase